MSMCCSFIKSQILPKALKMVEIDQDKTGALLLVPGHSGLQSKTQYGKKKTNKQKAAIRTNHDIQQTHVEVY